ncbi:MAG: hypothetical protein NC319_06395, partial [Butyricicoccus sp.]|nr:hypothetical protein [Butyricicoccus sp.]
MEFYRFCTCGADELATLKDCVDRCGASGRSYEFAGCAMPDGCSPERARVGFWKTGGDYWLYMRPEVSYGGGSAALRDFFARGSTQRFRSFDSMAKRLRSLMSEQRARGAPGGSGSLFERLRLELGSR